MEIFSSLHLKGKQKKINWYSDDEKMMMMMKWKETDLNQFNLDERNCQLFDECKWWW